jgi:hypothetical protein
MNRRKFFSLWPLSLLGFMPKMVETEVIPVKEEIPSSWIERTCLGNDRWGKIGCGTRYKFLRGGRPICPTCNRFCYLSYGFEVKSWTQTTILPPKD